MKKHLIILLFISNLFSGTDNIGGTLPLISIIPFIGILFSIAIIPILKPEFWHNNFGKISALWAMLFIRIFSLYNIIISFIHNFRWN